MTPAETLSPEKVTPLGSALKTQTHPFGVTVQPSTGILTAEFLKWVRALFQQKPVRDAAQASPWALAAKQSAFSVIDGYIVLSPWPLT